MSTKCSCRFDDEVCRVCGLQALEDVERLEAELATVKLKLADAQALLAATIGTTSTNRVVIPPRRCD